jgi:hypothetical protein
LYLVVNKLKGKKTAAQDVSLMKNIITFGKEKDLQLLVDGHGQ